MGVWKLSSLATQRTPAGEPVRSVTHSNGGQGGKCESTHQLKQILSKQSRLKRLQISRVETGAAV